MTAAFRFFLKFFINVRGSINSIGGGGRKSATNCTDSNFRMNFGLNEYSWLNGYSGKVEQRAEKTHENTDR